MGAHSTVTLKGEAGVAGVEVRQAELGGKERGEAGHTLRRGDVGPREEAEEGSAPASHMPNPERWFWLP